MATATLNSLYIAILLNVTDSYLVHLLDTTHVDPILRHLHAASDFWRGQSGYWDDCWLSDEAVEETKSEGEEQER